MKGLTTVLDSFKVEVMSEKCYQGFGPAHCTKVMCKDGDDLTNCCYVLEWMQCRQQELLFSLFWINCVDEIGAKK